MLFFLCFIVILVWYIDMPIIIDCSSQEGLAMGYIDVREHFGGERHFDVDWSPIIEDLYSPELGNPLGCRGSACVEVMSTLHGSAPSLRRRAEGCVPREGTIASARDLLKSTYLLLEPSIDTFSLGSTSWIRIEGRLIRVSDQLDQRSDQRDMDSQIVTVDQFAEAMASIQEAIASLDRRIDGQQAQQVPPQDDTQYDPTMPPPPSPSQSAPQAMPFTLHSQTEVAPPPITVPTPTSEDPHARMDRLEQGLRQLRTSDKAITWENFDGVPVASLPAKFRMLEIERYTGIGCPCIHLRLYSMIMRAHGLDRAQMIMLFPMSLGVSSFISRWRGKIPEIIDRLLERDQVQMVLRSLQPKIARHVVGVPFADFGSLVLALYDGRIPANRSVDVAPLVLPVRGLSGAISWSHSYPSLSLPMHLIRLGHGHLVRIMIIHTHRRLWLCLIMPPRALRDPWFPTATRQPCYAFSQLDMPLSQVLGLQAGLLLLLLLGHHLGRFHLNSRWIAAHTIGARTQDRSMHRFEACRQGLIDQGLVHLGQPNVTTNPLPTHTTQAVPPLADGIHFLDFDEIDDHIHTLSDDNSDPEPIMPDVIYEMSGVTLGPWMPAPFRLVPEAASVQAATIEPLILPHYSVQVPFILIPDVEGVQAPRVDDPQTLDVQYILQGGRVIATTSAARRLRYICSQ
ncbi:hypothetical protein AAG906_020792 [Vitis piasezkii]